MAKGIVFALLLGLSAAVLGNPRGRTELRGKQGDLVTTYREYIGVKEATGGNDGVEVEAFLQSAGLGKGYAWCAAFAGYCHVNNQLPAPNKFAWSPSWFPATKLVAHEQALPGDVFGIYYNHLKRIGHVGFIDEPWPSDKGTVLTVEGNTNGEGSREGDGVYRKRRSKNQIKYISRWWTP